MCNIVDFLNTNSGAIQGIMVTILVGVTIWYAFSSKKMASVMQQQYQISIRPYLFLNRDIKRLSGEDKSQIVQLQFFFTNVSNVAIEYYTDELTLEQMSINPQNKTHTILFPKQEGSLFSNYPVSDHNIGNGDGLKGSIKVVFWAQGNANGKYFFQRNFQLATNWNTFILAETFGKM